LGQTSPRDGVRLWSVCPIGAERLQERAVHDASLDPERRQVAA
jgi:hypothetical protein